MNTLHIIPVHLSREGGGIRGEVHNKKQVKPVIVHLRACVRVCVCVCVCVRACVCTPLSLNLSLSLSLNLYVSLSKQWKHLKRVNSLLEGDENGHKPFFWTIPPVHNVAKVGRTRMSMRADVQRSQSLPISHS